MSIAHVRKAQRAYTTTNERAAAARAARDSAVRDELAAGTPYAEIMAATGLSRARLAQIKRGTR